jgi:hypothetical protein
MLDGSAIYYANESGDPDAVEKFEFDAHELIQRGLEVRTAAGRIAAGLSIEYVPEHYLIPDPGLPHDYSPSTCRFHITSGNPANEEVLYIFKKSTDGPYTPGRHNFGASEELDAFEMLSGASKEDLLNNLELERSLETRDMTSKEYNELIGFISLLESLK